MPILFLDAMRGGGSSEEPGHRLRQPPGGGWAVFALQVDPPLARSYQVILRDAGGRELWRGKGLQPDERETLNLSLPGSLLAPGDYTLAAEGAGAPGGRFTFRVLPR